MYNSFGKCNELYKKKKSVVCIDVLQSFDCFFKMSNLDFNDTSTAGPGRLVPLVGWHLFIYFILFYY